MDSLLDSAKIKAKRLASGEEALQAIGLESIGRLFTEVHIRRNQPLRWPTLFVSVLPITNR
jgi:hypothetical protein